MGKLFRVPTKEIKISMGTVVLKEIYPTDRIALNNIMGIDAENQQLMLNGIVAISIGAIYSPDYENYPNYEDHMILDDKQPDNLILDEKNPENYIQNPENPDDPYDKILDPVNPNNYILDPINPHNYMLDKTKAIKTLVVIREPKDIMAIIKEIPDKDWTVIALHAMQLNEPSPHLLGK